MLYEFNVYQMQVDGHTFWIAESKSLKGCVGQGESSKDAIDELEKNEIEWLETAKDFGIPIPPVSYRKENTYSGKFSLRISPILHEQASEIAAGLGISLNQYMGDALAFYNAEVQRRTRSTAPSADEEVISSKIISFSVFNNSKDSYTKVDIVENLEEM